MFTLGVTKSSCSNLEAIAQVGVSNIAVLAMRRDARTSTRGRSSARPLA